MKILFDQGTPDPLRKFLPGHQVHTAMENGWSTLENGELLRTAENDGYDILITTDQNLKYQQNLKGRKIGIVVLLTTSWPKIQQKLADVVATINQAAPGGYIEIKV
jgi:predicted nuclease of predicted toxin-antitoxin system